MQVVIRVDASTRIGIGHTIRCRTLGNALVAHGAEVTFVSRRHEGHGIDLLKADGFTVHELLAPEATPTSDTDYAGWLSVSVREDAAETLKALPRAVDWLVVDHYGLGAEGESRFKG